MVGLQVCQTWISSPAFLGIVYVGTRFMALWLGHTQKDGYDSTVTVLFRQVDLAGSENIGRSGAIDKRAREAGG